MAGVLLVELKAGLDEPDGVGGGACDDAGDCRSAEVYPGGLDAVVEGVCYYAFPIAVGGEVYRSMKTNCQLFRIVGMVGIYLAGTTPLRFGPRPLKRACQPSTLCTFLQESLCISLNVSILGRGGGANANIWNVSWKCLAPCRISPPVCTFFAANCCL